MEFGTVRLDVEIVVQQFAQFLGRRGGQRGEARRHRDTRDPAGGVDQAAQLGFGQVSEIVASFIRFGGDILLGSAILVIGFWLANLAHDAIQRASGPGRTGLARIGRFAILGLVIAMGLRAMGIANEIVQLAFGLTLGSIAVAVALAFGLGGREAAGKLLEHWLTKLRKD